MRKSPLWHVEVVALVFFSLWSNIMFCMVAERKQRHRHEAAGLMSATQCVLGLHYNGFFLTGRKDLNHVHTSPGIQHQCTDVTQWRSTRTTPVLSMLIAILSALCSAPSVVHETPRGAIFG